MIYIKTDTEVELMRESAEVLRETMRRVGEAVSPGVTTAELDRIAEEYIGSRGASPGFKGYRGYPATICASVNEQVVHGIPGPRKLKEGDIVGIDIGVIKDGYYSDMTRSYPVGVVDEEASRILRVTMEALDVGIDKASAGNHLSDISHAIQKHAEDNGYKVVKELVGHGVGRNLHEDPQIPNFGPPGMGPVLKPGMVFALEPMLNIGTAEIVTLEDRWTIVTGDGSLSCHFEDTIAVTLNGPRVLTR